MIVDDLDHHLARRDAVQDFVPDGARAHGLDEVFDDRQRDIGLEQRDPDFTQRRLDIRLSQRAAPRDAVENAVESVG